MKTLNRICFILLALFLISCEDIIEEDISDDTIQLAYPTNDAEISSNIVNFQWNSLEGASIYRLQVFISNTNMVLDSLVTKSTFQYPLSPGSYTWRVRGENFAYVSNYSSTANFSVIETDDLSSQQVLLSSPSDAFYTNNTNIILTWQSINVADSYTFELLNISNGNTVINQQSNLMQTNLSLSSAILSQNAEYRWRIKAINSTSETAFAARRFYIDTSSPNQATNVLPSNNSIQILNQPITFTWNVAADSGVVQSPIIYTIQFSSTTSFGILLQSSDVSNTTFQQSFDTTGDYYWRVFAKDAAGNTSIASSIFKFTIN